MKYINLIAMAFLFLPNNLMAQKDIFPTPVSVVEKNGAFQVTDKTEIHYDSSSKRSAAAFHRQLCISTGFDVALKESDSNDGQTILFSSKNVDPGLGKEGYTLEVSSTSIVIEANRESGFFYGVQSLRQLLPTAILTGKPAPDVDWKIGAVSIKDQPRYAWRSFMLDSGRQYQSVAFIKRYLDLMAFHKMNTFHWHLSENLGWRIESKKYPNLHLIGSTVGQEEEMQGYYTRDEIRELVKYAAERHITIVPEIDIPGHSEAAMLSYPELTCAGQVTPSSGHSKNIYCGGKAFTYKFTKEILEEICEIFPSPYIHVGGDEAPKGNWEKCRHCQAKIKEHNLGNTHNLQIHLMNHLADVLKAQSRKAICWDDVLPSAKKKGVEAPELRDNIVIAWWHNHGLNNNIIIRAVKADREVICNPNKFTYLNFPVTPWRQYGVNRTFDLQDIFKTDTGFEGLSQEEQKLILGWGASLWTDFNVLEKSIDKRIFPRIVALGENMWQGKQTYSFEEFYSKLKASHYPRLKALEIEVGPALRSEVPADFSWD